PAECTLNLRQDDFARVDLDQVDVRNALPAFLAGGAGLGELDLAVEPVDFDLPERGADGFRVGLTGLLDRGGDRLDAVVAAEALRHARERETALFPFREEALRRVWRRGRFRHPRREESQMHGAIDGAARLLDELIGTLRSSGGDDATLHPESRHLLEDKGELLDGGGDV